MQGILLHNGAGRVQDAYLDYAPLVIRSPANVQVRIMKWRAISDLFLPHLGNFLAQYSPDVARHFEMTSRFDLFLPMFGAVWLIFSWL